MKINLPLLLLCMVILLASASPTASAAPEGPPAGTNWVQTFNDDFNSFDYSKWNTRYVWGPDTTINNELEYYVDIQHDGTSKSGGNNPFVISNGILTISATHAPSGCCNGHPYTSGAMTTSGHFSQTYGYFEMRAKMPSGKGLWPTFWLEPADNSWPPEFDVVEMVGQRPTQLLNTAHTNVTDTHTFDQCWPYYVTPDMSQGFHNYAIEWTPTDLTWYFDGNVSCHFQTKADQNKPSYILLNLAIGSASWWTETPDASTPFPQTFQIDYVRAYTASSSSSSYSGTPYTGTPASVPGTIQVENFDNGGEGVAYH